MIHSCIKKVIYLTLFLISIVSCYPTDNNLDEKSLIKNKKYAFLTNVTHPSQKEVAPFGLTIGKITVNEALSKYPQLIKADSSYISYGKKEIPMPNTYALPVSDNLTAFLQFDESTNILQNVLIFGLKSVDFDIIKQEFKDIYSPYEEYNPSEFEAFSRGETTFEDQKKFLEKHKNEIALFKNNGVIIILGKSINSDEVVIFYRNTSYLPVLKNKAEAY